MPLKRLLLLVAVGTLLSACSISDQEEESTAQTKSSTPNSTTSSEVPTTTSRSYDLNTKSGFIYHIKEHGTIPDYYLNVFASGAPEAEEGPTSYEVNATTLKKAGAVACNNDQILDDAKYLLTHGKGALAELAAKPEEFDQKYAPSTKRLIYQPMPLLKTGYTAYTWPVLALWQHAVINTPIKNSKQSLTLSSASSPPLQFRTQFRFWPCRTRMSVLD